VLTLDNQFILGGPSKKLIPPLAALWLALLTNFWGVYDYDHSRVPKSSPPPISAVIHSRRLKIELGVKNVIPSNN